MGEMKELSIAIANEPEHIRFMFWELQEVKKVYYLLSERVKEINQRIALIDARLKTIEHLAIA